MIFVYDVVILVKEARPLTPY